MNTNNGQPIFILFHIDFDGISSAAITAICEENAGNRVNLIAYNYGYKLNRERVIPGSKVYVLDITAEEDDMIYLKQYTDLIWIDHHIDINKHIGDIIGNDTNGIRLTENDEPQSGALLTWKFFHGDTEPPQAIKLIDAYDIWEHDRYPYVLDFQKGLAEIDCFVSKMGGVEQWKRILFDEDYFKEILSIGTKELTRQKKEDAAQCRRLCEKVTINGHPALIMNTSLRDSYMFDSVDQEGIDVLCGYYRYSNGKRTHWKFSLRTAKFSEVNVAEIARKFGGNGHPNSSGFVIDKLSKVPFLKHLI